MPKVRKLGKSYDCKKYIYSYEDINKVAKEPKPAERQNKYSLINASKTNYNIINHGKRTDSGSKVHMAWCSGTRQRGQLPYLDILS